MNLFRRRGVIGAFLGIVAAPAVVKATSIMPVQPMKPLGRYFLHYHRNGAAYGATVIEWVPVAASGSYRTPGPPSGDFGPVSPGGHTMELRLIERGQDFRAVIMRLAEPPPELRMVRADTEAVLRALRDQDASRRNFA